MAPARMRATVNASARPPTATENSAYSVQLARTAVKLCAKSIGTKPRNAPPTTTRSTRSCRCVRSARYAQASGTTSANSGVTANTVEISRPDSPSPRRYAGRNVM